MFSSGWVKCRKLGIGMYVCLCLRLVVGGLGGRNWAYEYMSVFLFKFIGAAYVSGLDARIGHCYVICLAVSCMSSFGWISWQKLST